MKRWLALLMAFLLVFSSCALAEPADATAIDSDIGNQLGFSILHQLYLYEQQALLSPASLTYALAMTAAGARGETREELLAALGIDELSLDALRIAADSQAARGVKIANAVFVASGIELSNSYLGTLRSALDAEIFDNIQPQDAVSEANDWARKKTDGMIDPLLEEAPGLNPLLMLVNALALDAKWRVPFDESATEDGIFYSPAGEITTPFLRATRHMDYIESEIFQAVYLPYEAESLGMYVILPNEDRIYDTLDAFAEHGMALLDGAQSRYVALSLPKIQLNASVDMGDLLKNVGVTLPFSPDADFSGISEDSSLYIDRIVQASFLEVSEQGTRAAAATAVAMAGSSMETDTPVNLTVDHPYLLLLYDGETNSILFAAAISDPLKCAPSDPQ